MVEILEQTRHGKYWVIILYKLTFIGFLSEQLDEEATVKHQDLYKLARRETLPPCVMPAGVFLNVSYGFGDAPKPCLGPIIVVWCVLPGAGNEVVQVFELDFLRGFQERQFLVVEGTDGEGVGCVSTGIVLRQNGWDGEDAATRRHEQRVVRHHFL